MKVQVLAFGVLRELLAGEQEAVLLETDATVSDLVSRVRAGRPGPVWDRIAVAVNREFAQPDRVLAEGDEVALLPPVSGGAQ